MSKVLATAVLSVILASSAADAATATKSTANPPVDTKQYCLTFADETGSHITRTECRTKKEWKQLGVDVDELSAKNSGGSGLA
jgi:hypothetical protein